MNNHLVLQFSDFHIVIDLIRFGELAFSVVVIVLLGMCFSKWFIKSSKVS